MLRQTKLLRGYKLSATDDELGKVKEFYFDDVTWQIRYMVADTMRWLPGRLVLVSPDAIQSIDEGEKKIMLNLSKEQIKNSPPIEMDKPVSRQEEVKLAGYYGWPAYWKEAEGDPALRSSKEIINYDISASDDKIGHVDDFIFDDMNWMIRYVIVDTANFLPGKKVLLAMNWVHDFDYERKNAVVGLKKDEIKDAPSYEPDKPIEREYEAELYDYYNQPHYW